MVTIFWIFIYFLIGFVATKLAVRWIMSDDGYMDDEDWAYMWLMFFFWPLMLLVLPFVFAPQAARFIFSDRRRNKKKRDQS